MNATQLDAMRKGREAAQERQRAHHAAQQRAYMRWVKDEASAYRHKRLMHSLHGHDSPEWRAANVAWHGLLKSMPTPPPDHAWTR